MKDVMLATSLWEGVEPGTLALLDQWLVSEGSHVQQGQPVARVVLVKSALEVTAPGDGMIEHIFVPEGQTFARAEALARLAEA